MALPLLSPKERKKWVDEKENLETPATSKPTPTFPTMFEYPNTES
jgi:hypothetical protein